VLVSFNPMALGYLKKRQFGLTQKRVRVVMEKCMKHGSLARVVRVIPSAVEKSSADRAGFQVVAECPSTWKRLPYR